MVDGKKDLPGIVGFSKIVNLEEAMSFYLKNNGFENFDPRNHDHFLDLEYNVNQINYENFKKGSSSIVDEIYGWRVIYAEKHPLLNSDLK